MEDDEPFITKVIVGSIEKRKHSFGPCRYCGYGFEQKNGRYGCGCSGASACPNCGCPVKEPLNK